MSDATIPSSSRHAPGAPPPSLRFLVSAREEQALRRLVLVKLLRKSSKAQDNSIGYSQEKRSSTPEDDYNATSIRLSVRLFLGSLAGLKLYDIVSTRLLGRAADKTKTPQAFYTSPSFRLSLSLSTLVFLHRILFRFFARLRATLLSSSDEHASSFRRRNPRVARFLTSRLTPAVGASSSSLSLLIAPADQTRLTIAIYVASRALEFLYNGLPERGFIKSHKPSWLGAWCLMPVACAQLLHAFVFDRDCFPTAYGGFILKRSPEYIQQRPQEYPVALAWPSTFGIVDALARISENKWPKFNSPILFPSASYSKSNDAFLAAVAPVVDPAHPAISRLSCAVLHPGDPSCGRTYVKYFLSAFPPTARFFTIIYTAFALLTRTKAFVNTPLIALNRLATRILTTTLSITAAIGGAWSSICLLQRILPGHVMPTSRWYLSGFLGGMAGWLERGGDISNFSYSARMSADSLWKVGKKKGWWRGVQGGDVLVFWASMALIGALYQQKPDAVGGPVIRKAMGVVRGEGWSDRAEKIEGERKKVEAAKEA